jgi:hypothetical protein
VILVIGPIAVAGSMFPRYANEPAGVVLHRICATYAVIGLAVPLLGIATAVALGVLTDAWVVISIALTAAAAALLALGVLPAQRRALAGRCRCRCRCRKGSRHDDRHLQPAVGDRHRADDRATGVDDRCLVTVIGARAAPG